MSSPHKNSSRPVSANHPAKRGIPERHANAQPLNILILSGEQGANLQTRLLSPLEVLRRQTQREIHFTVINSDVPVTAEELAPFDVLILHKFAFEQGYKTWQLARRLGKALVYETDEWLLDVPEKAPYAPLYQYVDHQRFLFSYISEADGVIVATPALQKIMAPFQDRIYVVPTLLDETLWAGMGSLTEKKPGSPVIIGWVGSLALSSDLERIDAALLRIAEKYEGQVAFRFFGCKTPRLEKLRSFNVSNLEPDYRLWARKLTEAGLDIAIDPRSDSPYHRQAGAYPWMEYTAAGAVSVCSPVGAYANAITPGKTGFLAGQDAGEWFEVLDRLVASAELRRQVWAKAQKEIRERFTLQAAIAPFSEALDTILKNKAAAPVLPAGLDESTQVNKRWTLFWKQMIDRRLQKLGPDFEKAQVLQQAAVPSGGFTVDIVIPMYKHADQAEVCIDTTLATTGDRDHLILIDDASPGKELDPLFDRLAGHPRVTLLRNQKNAGFLPTVRRGARAGSAPFILFLNSDTECTQPGWVEKLIPDAGDVGVTGAKLIYPPDMDNGLGGLIQHAGVARNGYGEPYHFFMGWPSDAAEVSVRREVNCVTGGCLMARRSLWEEIGGFDPVFGRGVFEDVDFCWSTRRAGYKVVYQPEAVLYHREHCGVPIHKHIQSTTLGSSMDHLMRKWGRQPADESLFLPKEVFKGWQKARGLIKQMTPATAMNLSTQALQLAPDLPEVLAVYAQACLTAGWYGEARQALIQRMALEPWNGLAVYDYCQLLIKIQSWDEAFAVAKKAYLLMPHVPEIEEALIEIYCQSGRWPEFTAEYRQLLQTFPWRGIACLKSFKTVPVAALAAVRQELANRPDQPFLLKTLGYVLYHQGRIEESLGVMESYRKAYQRRLEWCFAMLHNHHPEKVQTALKEWMNEAPDDPKMKHLLAKFRMETGARFEGMQLYKELLPRLAGSALFLVDYLSCCLAEGEIPVAIALVEKITEVECSPAERVALRRLAQQYPDFIFLKPFLRKFDKSVLAQPSPAAVKTLEDILEAPDLVSVLEEKAEQFDIDLQELVWAQVSAAQQEGNAELVEGYSDLADYIGEALEHRQKASLGIAAPA